MRDLELELSDAELRALRDTALRRGMTDEDYARHAIRVYLGLDPELRAAVKDADLPPE